MAQDELGEAAQLRQVLTIGRQSLEAAGEARAQRRHVMVKDALGQTIHHGRIGGKAVFSRSAHVYAALFAVHKRDGAARLQACLIGDAHTLGTDAHGQDDRHGDRLVQLLAQLLAQALQLFAHAGGVVRVDQKQHALRFAEGAVYAAHAAEFFQDMAAHNHFERFAQGVVRPVDALRQRGEHHGEGIVREGDALFAVILGHLGIVAQKRKEDLLAHQREIALHLKLYAVHLVAQAIEDAVELIVFVPRGGDEAPRPAHQAVDGAQHGRAVEIGAHGGEQRGGGENAGRGRQVWADSRP